LICLVYGGRELMNLSLRKRAFLKPYFSISPYIKETLTMELGS
jgi:hypothetical protein